MTREELIAYDKWLTGRKWGTGEIISPERAADIYLAEHPLPPAEGAEKSCLSCRFHNSPTYHDKMWCRDCQQLSHYEQQPTAEGTGKTCHAKEMEYNHNMCAMQESCEKCEAYKVPTNEGDIAKTETDTGRIVDMPSLSLPPAEGAEEIPARLNELLGNPDKSIHVNSYQIKPIIVDGKAEWWIVHHGIGLGEPLAQWLNKFATLHAQRIAEKMVEERMEQYKAQFKDRPNPLEVNPYDSKGIKRIRNRKIH